MAFAKPVVMHITPFDATKEKKIEFLSIGGDQYNKVELRATQGTGETINIVYDTFSTSIIFPAGRISNASSKVSFSIRVGDGKSWSEYSEDLVVGIASTPMITIPNAVDGTVKNNIYTFTGEYSQPEDIGIRSFFYTLYDYNKDIKEVTEDIFDPSLSYTFRNLENNQDYFIKLTVTTDVGVVGSSQLYPIHISYIRPNVNSLIQLQTNNTSGDVILSTSLKQVIIENTTEDGSPIDANYIKYTNSNTEQEEIGIIPSGKISVRDGLDELSNIFSLKAWVRLNNVSVNQEFLFLNGIAGDIVLFWEANKQRFRVNKRTPDGILTFYVSDPFPEAIANELFTIVMYFSNSNIELWAESGGVGA